MAINVSDKILWFIKNFEEIWHDKYERFFILSLDYETLSDILSSEKLNVKSEYIVWKTIHNWVNFDKTNRLEHLPNLIENCLRFGRLDEHFIDVFIFECDLFMELSSAVQCGLKDFISTAFQNCQRTTTYNFSLFSSSCDLYFRKRGAHSATKTQHLLVCIDREKGLAEFYDNNLHSWQVSPAPLNLPNNQNYFRLALFGTKQSMLYAFGGWSSGYPTKQVWGRNISDPGSSQWTAMANMHRSRCAFASVVLNDNIYALGGKNKENDSFHDRPIRSCERYHSQLNQWLTLAPMNIDRADASAAVINSCIYIAGGWNGENVEKSVEKYDFKSKRWKRVEPMTTARFHFALACFTGRLWAIGGMDSDRHPLRSCESYDPVTDTWREEAPMKGERYEHAAIEFNGKLYVVGGREIENSRSVEKYLPGKGWTELKLLSEDMHYPQLITVQNKNTFFTFDHFD